MQQGHLRPAADFEATMVLCAGMAAACPKGRLLSTDAAGGPDMLARGIEADTR